MFNTGMGVLVRGMIDGIRYGELDYIPRKIYTPEKLIQSKSKAWVGLEKIILDIIEFSGIKTTSALEFGVEFGYSTAVFANFFDRVTGVDIFTGDSHAGYFGDIYDETMSNLDAFKNIKLVKADYKEFISIHDESVDLVHVDIVHTYEDTYRCGLWAAMHSQCTLFHDTQSFPEVKRAVAAIAKETGKKFYNFKKCNGLGILV